MPEDIKVTETPKVSADETLIVNRRAEIEAEVITENNTIPEPTPDETVEPVVEKKEEVKSDEQPLSEIDKIKQSVQKRIDKVVAKQKSAEEQLAEANAEIARLKATPKSEVVDKKVDDAPPTVEQVEAYIVKMREEGNVKEEVAATRYLIKLEKETAFKEIEEKQNRQQNEVRVKAERENAALLDLAKDYVVYNEKGEVDMKSDLTLANQKGKLFEVAMALYNDPELHKLYYNDPDRASALRRATADAYREIHQQGLIKTTPKVDLNEARRATRQVLADPDAVEVDDTPTQTSNLLSDAEKVRDEIKNRNRMRTHRKVS